MTIKDIQVHVDIDSVCSKRVEIAANLAISFNSHLTGVHIRRYLPAPNSGMLSESANERVSKLYDEVLNENESIARATFDRVIGDDKSNFTWKSSQGSLTSELATESRFCDFLVIGQPDPKDSSSLIGGLADEVIITSGRPCLLVPYQGESIKFGESPLIPWDGSREASGAVHAALPLLKKAGKATILIVEPEKLDTAFGDIPGARISEHLGRHGIKVKVDVSRGSSQSTGRTIINYADEFGHDLIVMGAYGHARWREIVLGGATRTILKDTKVPVLMSH